jgi:hypothetical protein
VDGGWACVCVCVCVCVRCHWVHIDLQQGGQWWLCSLHSSSEILSKSWEKVTSPKEL